MKQESDNLKKEPHKTYRYKTITVLFSLLFAPVLNLFAQSSSAELFDLSGRIVSSDSLEPIPNVHVLSKNNRWGTISDEEGFFRMLVSNDDSIMLSSIGYGRKIVWINDSIRQLQQPVVFTLDRDTVLIHEVVIHGYWDYRTFKQMIISMKPLDLKQFYPDLDANPLLYYNPPHALVIKGPIQALYDAFNKTARLERKLIKNRKEYNQLMINLGRAKDTIPSIPEHMQEKQH